MIIAVNWAKEYKLIGNEVIWYKERWEGGAVLENERGKLVWDFKFNLRKTAMARRSYLILEDKEKKKIWICYMACPQQQNIATKQLEKLTKYRQLAFETRETCGLQRNGCALDNWSPRWQNASDRERHGNDFRE